MDKEIQNSLTSIRLVIQTVIERLMHVPKFIIVLLLSVAALLPSPALADGKQNFTLENRTGYKISEVYVSPGKASTWEEDVLTDDELPNGESVAIRFSRSEKSCNWDLKVVYDDGETVEWEDFDLCEISNIRLFYNRKKGTSWAETE